MRLKSRKMTVFVLAAAMAIVSPVSVLAAGPEVKNDAIISEEKPEDANGTSVSEGDPEDKNTADADIEKPGEGKETGVGAVEGTVETDVYQVVLPTVKNSAFDFIIDPQGLINKTKGAAYDGKTFEDNSTLFFKRTDGKVAVDYSSTSDVVTIKNMGSNDIEVSLHISVLPDSLGGIHLSGDREFQNDTSASIYLALVDGENIVPIGTDGINMDMTINAAPEEAYEYGYDKERGEYTYELKENTSDIEFGSYSFQITGAANGKGDWTKLTKAKPQIKVEWKITSKEAKEGEGQ